MYPYHNKIKSRIKEGELIGYEYVDGYNHIDGRVLLLYFSTVPHVRPVREYRINEYQEYLEGIMETKS